MVNILNPLDRLALARNHLQASRSYAAAVIDRIRQVEVCCQEWQALLRSLQSAVDILKTVGT